jgi:2-amino-4-hydroxy-6-hydroxymethyldihydropteridine diphosphokinase
MVSTFLSLGSNLGDREHYLENAILSLGQHDIVVIEAAGIYETEPREVTDQPWFLNTVVRADTDLAPHQLLNVCMSIERKNDRVRLQRKSARTLDIDIVFYGDQIVNERGLTIPHPRYAQRKFVLVPLAEIAATFEDPATGTSVAELLRQCSDTSEVRRLQ